MRRVLLLDPDVARRDRLCHGLTEKGLLSIGIGDRDGLVSIDLAGIDVVLSKDDLPSGPATRLRDRLGGLPLILFTDDPSVRRAVEAMQQGAADYLVLPFDTDEAIAAINRSLERSLARGDERSQPAMAMMVGHCPAMLNLFERIQTLGETHGSLLIQGESGSGKELVARAVHAASRRRTRPLISLNCATIPTSLIETELFGDRAGTDHRRGLVDAADEGTLFLDEISALPMEAQERLLQLLQEDDSRNSARTGNGSNVDVRVIAATHRDLRPLVDAGRFLEPLYVRLNATTLTVPPLRERGHDVVELANWLLRRISHKLSKPEMSLSESALVAIGRYDWPGNVRELENALERAVILCDGTVIEADLLAIDTVKAPRRSSQSFTEETEGETSLEGYFVKFVLEHQDALTETELASKLGISRKSLWERRQRLNIPRKRTGTRAPRRDSEQ
jgi:two-component system, NtrC family, response regulator HydG